MQNATSPITGPGSYDSHAVLSIAKEARKKFERMSRAAAVQVEPGHGSLGFDSKSPSRKLPHEATIDAQVPGPSAYNPEVAASKKTFNTKSKSGASAFGTLEKLGYNAKDGRNLVISTSGDPGAYTPNEKRELAYDAKKTFQAAYKNGKGAFGSTPSSMTKREMQMDLLGGNDDITPGPDTYNVDQATATDKIAMAAMSGKEKMPSSSFRSASRKGLKTAHSDQPGPGAYSPDPDATYDALPGASMKSNLISKTGRDHYLGAMDISATMQNATSPITGPGSYIPRVTNDGEPNTLEERVLLKADRGWSNYFTSDSIREMFTALVADDRTNALWTGHR